MQNMHWKILVILAALGISLWSITEYGLRFGKDLAGGMSLVYEVYLNPEDDGDAVVNQTITVIKNRLNPTGALDISVTQQGRNRIEVVSPLPSEAVTEAKETYERLMGEILDDARLDPLEVRNALADGTAVERFGAREDTPNTPSMVELQRAYDRQMAAKAAHEAALGADNRDTEAIDQAEEERAAAELAFDRMFADVIASGLNEVELRRMLDLSTSPQERYDREGVKVRDADGKVVMDPSPRDLELESMQMAYPQVSDELAQLVESFDTYRDQRRGFDDVEDLKRLMRGAGVLEFRIAARPGTTDQGFSIDQMRQDLEERGPEARTSTVVKWLPINDLKQWYKSEVQRDALIADPISYFERSHGMVAAEFGGEYYLLVYDTELKKLAHEAGSGEWSLSSARPAQDDLGRPAVGFTLDAPGGQRMGRLTGANVNEPMAIVLDDEVYSAPNINSRIGTDGIIQGTFSQQEINYLIRVLASGSLSNRLSEEPISVTKLGPSIGADNLNRGLEASLIAIIAVAAFMAFYYFFAGAVADFALLTNGVLIFGLMSMQQASFTLPGIAGIVLTIGMAVDANVLIYERIREEFFDGEEDLKNAIRLGYSKALSTIIDANVTNLIVCVVLYQTATAEVKGFALTLGLGILATLFTALFVTRVIFTLYTDFFKATKLPMLPTVVPAVHRALEPAVNWIGLRTIFRPISVVLVITGLVLVATRGVEMYDTEFRGGVSATLLTRATDDNEPNARVLLERQDVETRVHAIADQADSNDPNDPLRAFERAAVLAAGGNQEDGKSDSFQVKIAVDTEDPAVMNRVISALVSEFEDVIDSSPPSTFPNSASELPPAGTTFPVNRRYLGEVVDRQGLVRTVDEYNGGVAVLVSNLSPPVQLEDVNRRIARMRLQPDFSAAASRRWEVIGIDKVPGEERYASVVLLSYDDRYEYTDNVELWDEQMANVEWSLLREALTQEATLESVNTFSASVAQTLAANAVVAVGLSLIGILVYIWVRFGSFWYSFAAIVALVHDVSIALGALAITYFIGGTVLGDFLLVDDFRIDLGVVAAMLTIIGYSLNDTIVIMDRIRENRGKRMFADLATVNRSINQTISRTVLTSFTTLVAVGIMYVEGGTGIRPFAFCLLVGIFVGTYSSVAIAAPLVWRRKGGAPPAVEADSTTESGGDLTPATA